MVFVRFENLCGVEYRRDRLELLRTAFEKAMGNILELQPFPKGISYAFHVGLGTPADTRTTISVEFSPADDPANNAVVNSPAVRQDLAERIKKSFKETVGQWRVELKGGAMVEVYIRPFYVSKDGYASG
jgi:hypothetical protein